MIIIHRYYYIIAINTRLLGELSHFPSQMGGFCYEEIYNSLLILSTFHVIQFFFQICEVKCILR